MTEQTEDEAFEALQLAIKNYAFHDDSEARIVTDFVVVLASTGFEDQYTSYSVLTSETPPHSILGLFDRGQKYFKEQVD